MCGLGSQLLLIFWLSMLHAEHHRSFIVPNDSVT
jgi:hypothetical protein